MRRKHSSARSLDAKISFCDKALSEGKRGKDEGSVHRNPDVKFLGFGFWQQYDKKSGGTVIKDRPHQKSLAKCKDKLRELTARNRGQSLDVFRKKLKEFVRGWMGYFGRSSLGCFVRDTDQWLRRRIRQIYWKQWKKVSMRYRALRRLGMSEGKAWEWANTRKSYWRVANSWILATTLTNDFLRSKGGGCVWRTLADRASSGSLP